MSTYTCPHCASPLQRKFLRTTPAPGERRFLPLRGILLCPVCGKELHPNPHPAELKLFLAAIPFATLMTIGPAHFPSSRWFAGALAAALLFLVVVTVYIHLKYLRNWPAFSATPAKPWFK